MRVLFIDQFSDLGGAQACLRDVIAEAQRRAWQVELLAPGDGPLLACAPSHPLPISPYANGRKSPTDFLAFGTDFFRMRSVIAERIRIFRPDLVYVNGPRVLPAAATAWHGPLVFHSHSLLNKAYSRRLVQVSLSSPRATVLAACQHVATALPGQPRIVCNGVPDQGFLPRPAAGRDPLHIGILGRIAPEKGQLDFVHAAQKLAATYPALRFSIIGAAMFSNPAYDAAVREAAAGLPVAFSGWSSNVAESLHRLDIVAIPSTAIDATPRVIMEALSAGTPIVAYPAGGFGELLTHNETALFTPAANPAALAQTISELLARPDLQARLSHQGRRAWETRFHLERFQREVCDLLEEAAHDHRAALPTSDAIADT